jgi:GntR family transcriptional repressor for pyruvate dehydrogenase complex
VTVSADTTIFAPVAAPSTYEHTLERLGTAIRIGLLAAGERLPPERELAEQFGISRSTLRQALATLTESGHLVAVRGRAGGTFVSEEPPVASARPYPLEHSRAMLDWRIALELGTVQLAAERATPDERAALADAAATHTNGEDWATFRRWDASFHVLLAQAAHSGRVVAAMTRVQGEMSDLLIRINPVEETRPGAAEQHRQVALAVARGDASGAREAMRLHLHTTARLLDERLAAS